VALKGLRNDGHRFLAQAWQSGVRNFIVNADASVPELPDSNVFSVPDTIYRDHGKQWKNMGQGMAVSTLVSGIFYRKKPAQL
jgi:UDP-N-acetylmuramyl pentapeptide synthase